MELIRGIHNLGSHHYGCVLTIGNFDGFHLGHQSLIKKLYTEGRHRGLPVIVIIFEPHPQEYFSSDTAPARLFSLRDKLKYLSEAGVDMVLCINFNKWFSELNADIFVTDLLVKKLGVRFISIGYDFRFGAGRQGDYALLYKIGRETGFEVANIVTYIKNHARISSTKIRKALEKDRLLEAEMLLGRPYSFTGRVVHGDALGRTIGFPTANVSLKSRRAPINGVYAVEVYGVPNNKMLYGVANVGIRPTVAGFRPWIEVYLLDVTMNLYGKHIEVIVRKKIRNEKRFSSLEDLKNQITSDVVSARDYFGLMIPQ